MSKCGNCYYGVMTGPNRMFCSAQNCSCEEVFDCEDYDPIVKPQTNADRIRSMGDIELGNFLSGLCNGCVNCPMYYPEENDECVKNCNSAWQEWVKQESEEK